MVVIMKHKYLPKFLRIMKFYFDKYSLIFNAKKSAITCIKNHNKIKLKSESLLEIPICNDYKYLGIWINETGNIEK